MSPKARRPRAYRQNRRARQADANTARIIDAAGALILAASRVADITLEDVARESAVTVRTILRRFGSRDAVLEAAFGRLRTEIGRLRRPTWPDDIDAAMTSLLDQYEQMGDFHIRALQEEHHLPTLHRDLETARQYHRDWIREIFALHLEDFRPDDRERRVTALFAATDVYLWKLLRRDLQLDRARTEDTFRRLVQGVLTGST
jgi:AcrR family transcriptional regulator